MSASAHTDRSLPFIPLHGYRLVWRVADEKGGTVSSGERELKETAATMTFDEALISGSQAKSLH